MLIESKKEKDKIIIPPIKCQGIKTKLIEWIATKLPQYNTWYEPFCGTCVVGFNIKPNVAVFGDNNPHLINFYKNIQSKNINHQVVREFLEQEGDRLLNSNGDYYYEVRSRFNSSHSSLDFLFLNRSCFNGIIRFNSKGGFNTPFCRKPNRFTKSYITKICNQVQNISKIILNNDYKFMYQEFTETIKIASNQDFVYCDPPYIARHTDYFTSWDVDNEKALYNSLKKSNSNFILSTWHSNRFRKNDAIQDIWNEFYIDTKEHFYFVGAKESNRNFMKEALICKI